MEETDLCVRAARAGWGVFIVPQALAVHLQGKTAANNRTAARIEYYRSRYIFFRKHRGLAATVLLAGGLLARLALETALQGAACAATLFQSGRLRSRWSATVGILTWHMAGCPAWGGLSGLRRGRVSEEAA